jgi:hypothetical protein
MKASRRFLPQVKPFHLAVIRKTFSAKQFMPLCFLLWAFSMLAQSALAQAPNSPLNFGNNFFVTGDYIVAGATGMTTSFTTINGASYAVGTITVPDPNPGITGTKQVPPGAQIVAALLYWQTAEKVAVTPGSAGSGQNGFFRPLLYSKSGGPAAPGYAISGTNLNATTNVAWSSGGCNGGSTGKVLRTYRADVAGAFPLDANGNPTANTSFEVRLPSAGNATPLTLGATLVVIYRIPSGAGGPDIPLNSIVIYDGDYSQGVSQLTMTQQLQGFYDAAHNPISRLTHIVGSGQSNKFQTVYLSSGTNAFVKLPFLYGNKQPAFPGYYGTWDNPTWTFNSASPITEDSSYATTQVVPSMSNQGCVSWGAVIVSTTVKNSDNDGLLDSWKANQGYCDASINASCNKGDPAWVDLTGAMLGEKDIFLQYDYMCSNVQGPASAPDSCAVAPNGDYSFDPRLVIDPADGKTAVDKVVDAFNNHTGSPEPFVLHAIPGNAIAENQSAITCVDSAEAGATCPFPSEPGTVGFREGLTFIKNQNINPTTGLICNPGDTGCVQVFQHGKKDSYHYTLFSHGVGLPSWFLSDPTTLTSVKQSANTVTFTAPAPHGITHIAGDFCTAGRVTVVFAITNPSLNGTYCIKNVTPTSFQITVGGTATNFTYTSKTDPNLAVANGQVSSMSGFSDVGGQNSVVSLGEGAWGPANNPTSDGNKWQTKAGTFMHELGHTLGLTHGGTFYNNLAKSDYTPNFEANCKPNVQSSMSYLFQVDLLEKPNQLDSQGQPLRVVDYSEAALPTLNENSPQVAGLLSNAAYAKTAWFQLTSFAGGAPVSPHCDGTPVGPNEQSYSYVTDLVSNFFWSSTTGADINYDGSSADVMDGHDEWDGTVQSGVASSPGVDLQQISAVGTITTIGPGGEAGALRPAGGGGALHPAGGGGALRPAGGGGALRPAGGGGLTGEITHEGANSYARPPDQLFITQEEASPRLIDLNWFAPSFGQVVNYKIYRSVAGGAFTVLSSVPGTQTRFQDTVTCNLGGYSYRTTAVTNNDAGQPQESSPSNTVPATGEPLLTGCYTVGSFSVPASSIQGSSLQISWSLADDFYTTPPAAWAQASSGNPVTRLAANGLVAIGPLPGNCTNIGRTTLVADGVPTNGADTFTNNSDQFTFTWNNTDAFCSGSYQFELDLDHASDAPAQKQTAATALQLGIDVNDQDAPQIANFTLPDATVGVAFSNTLTEDGGVGAITWSISQGSLPPGFAINPSTGEISKFATTAGTYQFTAKVTDSKGNIGTQVFTLKVHPFVSASQPALPFPFIPATMLLPDATVGIPYSNTVYENGGVIGATPVVWTISSGSTPNLTFATNGVGVTNGTLSGTPTTAGTYTFMAMVSDSQGNVGMQTLTLVVDMPSRHK